MIGILVTILTKLIILAVLSVGEIVAIFLVARVVPAQRRGPILPVIVISSIIALSLVGYLLFFFV